MVNERMKAWLRMHGPESFAGEAQFMLRSSAGAVTRSSEQPLIDWQLSEAWADATLVQGSSVQHFAPAQRRVQPWRGHKQPDWQRPCAVIEPTHASVPAALRMNPKSLDSIQAMWDSFTAELAPLRLQFTAGLRSYEQLSRMSNPLSSQAQFHMVSEGAPLAALEPEARQIHLSPNASAGKLMLGQWKRRSSRTASMEGFAPMSTAQVLGVYCERTTRKLFNARLSSAQFSLRSDAVVRLSEHSDQALGLLVRLRTAPASFEDLAQTLSISDDRLGNVLLGLYLSGIVHIELGSAIQTVFRAPPKPKSHHRLTFVELVPSQKSKIKAQKIHKG
jgi:hypothetical protein